MANEATVSSSMVVKKGNLLYTSRPTSYKADVGVEAGPSPGKITVTTEGVDVDLSEVTSPGGLARLQNLDDATSSTNYVEVGI